LGARFLRTNASAPAVSPSSLIRTSSRSSCSSRTRISVFSNPASWGRGPITRRDGACPCTRCTDPCRGLSNKTFHTLGRWTVASRSSFPLAWGRPPVGGRQMGPARTCNAPDPWKGCLTREGPRSWFRSWREGSLPAAGGRCNARLLEAHGASHCFTQTRPNREDPVTRHIQNPEYDAPRPAPGEVTPVTSRGDGCPPIARQQA